MPNPLTPSEQLTYATVRIECVFNDGSTGTGTGFCYAMLRGPERHMPAIVTNKHVVEGAVVGRFNLTLKSADGSPRTGEHLTVELTNFQAQWVPHPDPAVDLCVMPIAPLITAAEASGKMFFYVTFDETLILTTQELDQLGALEEIVMVGYPNGIWDSRNNMPILRRGITATHPNLDYEGRKEFLIDAACFPGSSGSPVLLFNVGSWLTRGGGVSLGTRAKLLGILYAGPQYSATGEVRVVTIPTQQRTVAVTSMPINLGYVIKAERIQELERELRKRFPNAA